MNDRDSRKPHAQNDQELDWLAFCYLANELDDTERIRFESLLENDATAQQAVVEAMEQTQLIYASLDQAPVPIVQRVSLAAPVAITYRRKLTRVLLASVAALLLIVTGWDWYAGQHNAPIVDGDSDGLASAWVETLVAMNDDSFDGLFEEEVTADDFGTDYLSDDWMFVALTDLEDSTEGAD